jgi:hypothetical protein
LAAPRQELRAGDTHSHINKSMYERVMQIVSTAQLESRHSIDTKLCQDDPYKS